MKNLASFLYAVGLLFIIGAFIVLVPFVSEKNTEAADYIYVALSILFGIGGVFCLLAEKACMQVYRFMRGEAIEPVKKEQEEVELK
jgi:hypothetical protein